MQPWNKTVGDGAVEPQFSPDSRRGPGQHPPRPAAGFALGDPNHPPLALVGKGVRFDSGGLDLKPSGAMRLMKSDMGGAATALGLARLIMSAGLQPVRLRVLIAAWTTRSPATPSGLAM